MHARDARAAVLLLLALAVAALASAGSASALTTPVDKWVVSGDTITVEGQTFTIYLSSRANEILADYGTGSLFIGNNSCSSTSIARVCLDNVQYDFTDKVTKVKVRGVSLAPVIAITRTASKSTAIVSDAILFSVTLSNTGGLARNITYADLLPSELIVTETDGLLLVPDRAVWTGSLAEGESASFSYKVKALSTFEGILAASLTYNYGSKIKAVYSSGESVKISPAVSIYAGIGSTTALIGARNNITVNLTNSLSDTIVVSPLEVVFDPGIKVTSKPLEFRQVTPWDYVWTGEMSKVTNQSKNVSIRNLTNAWINTTRSWFFEFKGANAGASSIRVNAAYKASSNPDFKAVPEARQSVVVSNKGVIVRTSLKDTSMESNQQKRLKIWLQNLNPYAELRNVHANISTGGMVYLPDVFLGSMAAGEQVLLADKYFYAPKVTGSTGYVVATNTTYLTEFGDNFSAAFTDTATVVPVQNVELSQTASTTTAKAGDDIEITVIVRSSRTTSLRKVQVFDNVSSEFIVLGKNYAVVEVPSKGTVTAYTYKVRVNHIGRAVALYVNTTLKYSDAYNSDAYLDPQDYESTKVSAIAIEPESLSLTLTGTVSSPTTYVGQVFSVRYVITNTETGKVARNIRLKLPLAYGFDLVNSTGPVLISELAPGESVVLPDAEKLRAKFSGSVDFPMAGIEYENIYGDQYAINGTSSILAVTDNYAKGPVILVEKLAPQSANNTDYFDVQLKVRNTGTEPANVLVEDEGKQYRVIVQNKTEYAINVSAKYPNAGKHQLAQATATYSSNGMVFLTASKPATIDVIDNPALGIEKQAPGNVTNIEPYAILLKLTNKAQKPVVNITISDGSSWQIDAIPAGGQANVTYHNTAPAAGHYTLDPASATYSYENAYYTVQSNTAAIDVAEKNLVTITKEVTPANTSKGSKVKVSIRLKNLEGSDFDVLVADGAKTFSVQLPPLGEKDISYDSSADESTANSASATYTYSGRQLTALSASPGFSLGGDASLPEKVEKAASQVAEKEKTGILSKLLKALLSMLTWKRGG